MGGLAVIIDWNRPVEPESIQPMLDLIPHRATGGVRVKVHDHAILAEARTTAQTDEHNWDVATLGHFSIVGDIRLIRRDDIRARAGGLNATKRLSDSELILAGYERAGVEILDVIDGDFAFVIWDDEKRTALAVRDRFGSKPIFFERTESGVRFATEVKQLAATSNESPEPNPVSIAEYLLRSFNETRFTYFEGIERVRPSDALEFSSRGEARHRYWNPGSELGKSPGKDVVPELFREHLIEAVENRLTWSPRSIAQLSGGIDSTTVVGSAQLLEQADAGSIDLTTVSMVFPGYESDESQWINQIVEGQPFANYQFVPRIESIDMFPDDMWAIDSPRIDPMPDGARTCATTAHSVGAGTVLTGIGGDYILDESRVPQDVLRSGHARQWLDQIRSRARWTGASISSVAIESGRAAVPSVARNAFRRVRPAAAPREELLSEALKDQYHSSSLVVEPLDASMPSLMATFLASEIRQPLMFLTHELLEPTYAREGIELAHPYLDRALCNFVMSILPNEYPYDGSSKPLARIAFTGVLPEAILQRRLKTGMNAYLSAAFIEHSVPFRDRFPVVSENAAPFISETWYARALDTFDRGTAMSEVRWPLWSAWTLMMWLEELDRYG